MSTMNDGVDLSSIPESMDIDDELFSNLSNGLQQDFEAAAMQVNPENYGGFYQNSNIQSPFSNPMFSAVSPMTPQANAVPFVGPDDGSLQSERIDSCLADIDPMRVNSENVREMLMADPNALGESLGSSELNATRNASKAAAIQVNPENYGGFYQNSNIQSPFSNPMFSAVSPMTPQANAVHFVGPDDGSLQSERIDSSLADIDPMRVNSENVREMLMADPNALGESLGSIELNATRNASIQSNDQSQGPSASRMDTQRQAPPDSGQTQATSGTTANGTTAEAGGYFSDYELPEFHHFKVSVKFMSTPMLDKNVTKEGGCLLHYQASDQPPITAPAEVDRISIPVKIKNERDGSLQEFPWENDKQKRFTELILNNFYRGVEFYSREGNIYARRRSYTKLYWHHTEEQTGSSQAKMLNRNEETEVFNWEKFQQTWQLAWPWGIPPT